MIRKRLVARGIASYLSHNFHCNDSDPCMTFWHAHIDGAEEYYIISMRTGYDMVRDGIGIHYMGVINDDNKPGHLFDLEPIRAIAIWADTCEIALHWSDDTGEIVGPFGRANVGD